MISSTRSCASAPDSGVNMLLFIVNTVFATNSRSAKAVAWLKNQFRLACDMIPKWTNANCVPTRKCTKDYATEPSQISSLWFRFLYWTKMAGVKCRQACVRNNAIVSVLFTGRQGRDKKARQILGALYHISLLSLRCSFQNILLFNHKLESDRFCVFLYKQNLYAINFDGLFRTINHLFLWAEDIGWASTINTLVHQETCIFFR